MSKMRQKKACVRAAFPLGKLKKKTSKKCQMSLHKNIQLLSASVCVFPG